MPQKPNIFTNAKTAQDAHEAIRPTDVKLTPEKVKPYLDKDMLALYELIWRRFVASQMTRERLHVRVAEISAHGYIFVARGSKVVFDGFTKIYEAERREDEKDLPAGYGEGRDPRPLRKWMRINTSQPPSPLYRGIAHKDTRSQRHRPAIHLCGYRDYHTGPGLCE